MLAGPVLRWHTPSCTKDWLSEYIILYRIIWQRVADGGDAL
jgi:hypothetical protein